MRLNTITIEQLDKVLDHPLINLQASSLSSECFDRNRYFEVNGKKYRIEWFVNICYLICDELTVPFESVEQSNTWPNMSKMNLLFCRDGVPACILRIEKH